MEITRLALFSEFVGQSHPLLIHFPIGILLMAIALQFYQSISKKDFHSSISILVLIGSILAGISCLAGWLLASTGDYKAEAIFFHRWSGLATFFLALISYFWIRYRLRLFVVLLIFIILTGHYGSILTYGEGYFLKPKNDVTIIDHPLKPRNIKSGKLPAERQAYFYPYEDQIAPILKNKCYSCHSIQKKKGGLRLDSEFFIRKGGKHGHVLMSGNALKSHLYAHLILPEDDDLHMPPKGKRQLTRSEIQLIEEWIATGTPFGEVEQKMVLQSNDLIPTPVDVPKSDKISLENQIDLETLSPTQNLVLDKLKDAKISIVYSGAKNQWISLNFVNVKSDFNSLLTQTKSIKTHVAQLKLNNFDQIDFSVLRDFSNVRILNLGHTNLKDDDLVILQGLGQLEQLNLYGTIITDLGLMKLAECQRLKVLYLWDTKVSESGIHELKKKRPNLKIESGQFTFKLADTNLNKRLDSTK